MRALGIIVAVCALVAAGSVPASAAESDLAAARQRANQAAAELSDATSRLAVLEVEIAEREAHAAATAARLEQLRAAVGEMAVVQFMEGTDPEVIAVLEGGLGESARTGALARFVSARSQETLDAYAAVAEDLEVERAALAAKKDEAAEARAALQERMEEAAAELVRLEKLEAERRAREAAERRRRAQEAARQSATAAASQETASEPAPAAAPSPSVLGGGSWICPVQGPHAFTNDWGQPRSGGRSHQGTDILAPRGTPVVAPVAGSARAMSSGLGGLGFSLDGVDGTTYHGMHLDSLSGISGQVGAGTVLGYVGSTGNASGGATHLHFEMHPGGGAAVNPYPTLVAHC